jgi:hypothetical protein
MDLVSPLKNIQLIVIYRELGRISSKASPQQNKNWLAQALEKTDKIVSADKISQEITSYFEDIKNAFDACQVWIRTHMALHKSFKIVQSAEKGFILH